MESMAKAGAERAATGTAAAALFMKAALVTEDDKISEVRSCIRSRDQFNHAYLRVSSRFWKDQERKATFKITIQQPITITT